MQMSKRYSFLVCGLIMAVLYWFCPRLNLWIGDQPDAQTKTDDEVKSDLDLTRLNMHSAALVRHIQKYFIEPPSKESYNLKNPEKLHFDQYDQSKLVAKIFENMSGAGTFFEAGAYDGEEYSNSLYFERALNWSGLLVEPNPISAKLLRSKHRKATFVNSCLSGDRPQILGFSCERHRLAYCATSGKTIPPSNSSLTIRSVDSLSGEDVGVLCFPLYSILLAANLKEVDYMVLDLEGYELVVLEHFPFDKIEVKLLQLEFSILPDGVVLDKRLSSERLEDFRKFFATKWPHFKELKSDHCYIDIVFVNTKLLKHLDGQLGRNHFIVLR